MSSLNNQENISKRTHVDLVAMVMLEIRELVISGDEAGLQNALEKVEDEKCAERDWKWRGKEGRTVLELAAMLGRSKIVRLLVCAGAPPNVVSSSGEFYLPMCIYDHACYTFPVHGNLQAVHMQHSPHVTPFPGYGGLHFACIWGQLCCVRELVNSGGDHRLATEHNETPQQLAQRYGNTDCAQFLSCVGQCNIQQSIRLHSHCVVAMDAVLCVEARQKLHEAIQVGRATLGDPDLIAGKWNKDDKVCQECPFVHT